MKNKQKMMVVGVLIAGCILTFISCGGFKTKLSRQERLTAQRDAVSKTDSTVSSGSQAEIEKLKKTLDEIAELERAGSWLTGMAVTESTIRELAGDYPGAVAAAYKELALSYGRGQIKKIEREQGLLNLLQQDHDYAVTDSAYAILAFVRENWEKASEELALVFNNEEDPDSFANWMLLVCELEKKRETGIEDRRVSSAYRSIRARYSQFPEYWYRGARAFSAFGNETVAAEFAENCINISPEGPFADECRKIIAVTIGLKTDDGLSLKTKREIEFYISQSINTGEPKLLDSILPLISLPDNPYTMYAVGALKSLASIPSFREYFLEQEKKSRGRQSERLSYIARS